MSEENVRGTTSSDVRADQAMVDHLVIAVMRHRISRRSAGRRAAVEDGAAEHDSPSVLDLACHPE